MKMNATKYYVSTCRLVVQANPDNSNSWQDLYRVLPMLRNSLSCTVCQRLLIEPYTPEDTSCQHHVCKACRGGVKSLRPSCSWCKDYSKYSENVQLRLLIQSYKKLCSLIKVTLFTMFADNKEHGHQMIDIIRESEESQRTSITDYSSDFRDRYCKNLEIKEELQSEEEGDLPATNLNTVDKGQESEVTVRLRDDGADLGRVSPEGLRTPRKTEELPAAAASVSKMINPIVSDEIFSSPTSKILQQSQHQPHRILKTEEIEVGEGQHSEVKQEFDQLIREDSSGNWIVESTPYIEVDGIKNECFPTPSTTPQYSVSRSETPSPPNPMRFASTTTVSATSVVGSHPVLVESLPGTKVRESFILQPRSEPQGDARVPATSRINLGWGSTTGRKVSGGTVVNLTPLILPRNTSAPSETRAVLKPQKEDPLDTKNKAKKLGCRCGNATPCPGKLTCCGQRCPCYVSRLACLNCKCRGCNNPNLPGGGKVLNYLNTPVHVDAPSGSSSIALKVNNRANPRVGIISSNASSVVRVPSGNSEDADSMTDVDINTIPVVNLSSPASYRTYIGPSPIVQKLSLPNSQSAGSSLATASSSSLSTVTVVPASSISTVSIPLSSFAPGLKLRPVDQLQRKEIKARVIPTSFRLKAAPYTRLPVNGKVNGTNGVRLQTVSLMSLLKNSKSGTQTIQVLNKPEDQSDISIDI